MVKCDFPNCPADESMPFRCNRCDPPKYYCNKHRLPPSHNCLGITYWKTTNSPVTEIAISYERGGGATAISGSGDDSDIERFGTYTKTNLIYHPSKTHEATEKPKSWFTRLKEWWNKIINK
jgi:hypothetical protein